MPLRGLLDCTVTVTSGGEAIDPVTRRPVAGGAVRWADVPAAFSKRSDASTVYDESGAVVTDYDVVLPGDRVPVQGDTIESTAGSTIGRFVATGEARKGVRRRTGSVHHVTVPARRVG